MARRRAAVASSAKHSSPLRSIDANQPNTFDDAIQTNIDRVSIDHLDDFAFLGNLLARFWLRRPRCEQLHRCCRGGFV